MAIKQINPDLSDDQKYVLFNKGTEPPFSDKHLNSKDNGEYTCANCGKVVFKSDNKYESNQPGLIGWPSFSEIADSDAVELQDDNSYGMHRIEAVCKNCGSHLGHVFDDDSSSTGKHYCINSVCLNFVPKK